MPSDAPKFRCERVEQKAGIKAKNGQDGEQLGLSADLGFQELLPTVPGCSEGEPWSGKGRECRSWKNAAYAERSALWHAVAAAHQVGIDLDLLIDNEAVVTRLRRGLAGDRSGDCALFWHQLLDRWRLGSAVCWVPAHGHRPDR